MQTVKELEKAALEIRIHLLRLCHKEVIHIGGDLSVADLMTVLWQYQMKYDPENLQDETRDRFVLGMTAPAHGLVLAQVRYPEKAFTDPASIRWADSIFPSIKIAISFSFGLFLQADQRHAHRVIAGKLRAAKIQFQSGAPLFVALQQHAPQPVR